MAATLASASNFTMATPPFTTPPCTIAAWARGVPGGSGVNTIIMWDTGGSGTTPSLFIGDTGTGTFFQCTDGSSSATLFLGTSVAAGAWAFFIVRVASSGLLDAGVIQTGQLFQGNDFTHTNSGSWTDMQIGGYATGASGSVAEYWYTNTAPAYLGGSAGSSNMDPQIIRQLAYYGPFSMEQLIPDIVEYHSFRNGMAHQAEGPQDLYFGNTFGRRSYTLTGTVLSDGLAPPVLPSYIRQGQVRPFSPI